jgi:hypothetical protein
MAISYTANKNIQLPALNDLNWNVPLNANLTELDQLLGSSFPISIGTGTTVALTSATAAVSSVYWYSAQQLVITATGNLIANAIITLPANITGTGTMGGSWIVINDITTVQAGIYTLTVKPASGTGVIIKPEKQAIIFYDGTKVEYSDTNLLTQLDTIDGTLTVVGAATFNSTANFTDKIGLNGSYGTSGQFLTSAGASADPTWTSTSATGRLLRAPQVLTSGTSYTTPAGCTAIYVEVVGGGGAGAFQTGSNNAGGGGAGGYSAKYFTVTASTPYTYAIAAGGATRVSAGEGAAGGNTTFTVGATTISGNGGAGGNRTTNVSVSGGTGTNGDINISGQSGSASWGATPYVMGPGGSSVFGFGGTSGGSATPFAAGTGYGSGGAGAATGATSSVGQPGLIKIWEYS